jgi:hypothetical protein
MAPPHLRAGPKGADPKEELEALVAGGRGEWAGAEEEAIVSFG